MGWSDRERVAGNRCGAGLMKIAWNQNAAAALFLDACLSRQRPLPVASLLTPSRCPPAFFPPQKRSRKMLTADARRAGWMDARKLCVQGAGSRIGVHPGGRAASLAAHCGVSRFLGALLFQCVRFYCRQEFLQLSRFL
jgi:hypothetical protein